jgi:hypothetical protein
MKRAAAAVFILVMLAMSGVDGSAAGKRRIPCKTPENASTCYWTHGRLSINNGTPSFRLWKIGTHRILAVYSGPSVDRDSDNEYPELPVSVARVMTLGTWVYADFEVCPLEEEKPRVMQAICIESAQHIFADKP